MHKMHAAAREPLQWSMFKRPKAAQRVIFPAPGHDHGRCSTDAMTLAELLCLERGRRLTPIRRKVLAVLLRSHQPLGAYEIIGQIGRQRPAPITVYRALEFLRE